MSNHCYICGQEFGRQTGIFGLELDDKKSVCIGCRAVPCYHGPDRKKCGICIQADIVKAKPWS